MSGLTKPNIAAPGENVNSAWIGSDTSYRSISGTSMACPHVAGVVALMLAEKDGALSYDEIFKAMTVSATTEVLSGPGKNCGGNDERTYPNNAFGYGVAHAPRALDSCDGSTYAPTPAPEPPVESCKFNLRSRTCHKASECQGMCIPTFGILCTEDCELNTFMEECSFDLVSSTCQKVDECEGLCIPAPKTLCPEGCD